MNEAKKSYNDFMNKTVSEQKSDALDLSMRIGCLMRTVELNAHDFVLLEKMLKQLNQNRANLPRKVLRSMENKLAVIQQKYQR